MMQKSLLFILSLFFISEAFAAGNPHIINFPKETYEGDNKNWCIAQDERGTMYFANNIGLLEFDGIEWRLNYLPNSTIVRSVAAKSHQMIFTGSYEEFGKWERDISGTLQYTSLSEQIDKTLFKNDDFWKILIADEGVYFQSFSSIYLYDFETVRKLPTGTGILFLSQVRDEFLVQEMIGPVHRFSIDGLQQIPGSEIFRNTDVRVILPYGNNGYLLGTSTKGVYIYEDGEFHEWNSALSDIMKVSDLNCGILTSRGTYYLGTIVNGIYEVDNDGNILNRFSSENNLQNNTILSLYEDSRNNIWVALDRGIACIQYFPEVSYYTDPTGKIGAVYDVIQWNDKLFLATNQGVMYLEAPDLLHANTLSRATLIEGTQGQCWSFSIIRNRLYCCHNKGIKEITGDLKVAEPFVIGTGAYCMIPETVNGRDILLLATYTSLMTYDPATNVLQHFDEIAEPVINLLTDHLGNIWLEHANRGVYKCRPGNTTGKLNSYSYYGGNSGDNLPYKLTIFKVGGRIVLFGNDFFYTYDDINDTIVDNNTLNNCFAGIHHIRRIISIDQSRFMAITRNNIYRFTYDGYNASITGSYSLGRNMSLVNNYENISVLNDSTTVICMENGFALYVPGPYVGGSEQLPAPHLEFVQTASGTGNKQYMELYEPGKINYTRNTITFGFMAMDVYTRNLSFHFKLSGVDNDWNTTNTLNAVSYPRLPDGKYTFAVRTIDGLGNYSDTTTYNFEILPPWYRTLPAYLLYIVLILLTGYIVWMLILKRYRNLHLQKIRVRETRRLRLLADELQEKVKQKDAELFTQTSFIIRKNELIMKFKSVIDSYYQKHKNSASTEFYLKVNQLLNSNLDAEEDWKLFLIKFEEKHAGFFRKMKQLYPELTSSDLRLCACLKLNLETKEIASLMNLSIKAVENNRYRLRKKFNLQTTDNLNDFILNIE